MLKLPFAPLYRLSRCVDARDFADKVGSTPGAINDHRRRDSISWVKADRYACALDLHPCEVWGDAWFGDIDMTEVA